MIEIKTVNVVVSANLNRKINLKALAKAYPISEYNPKKFPAVIFKGRISVLVFASGKLIATGAKSERQAKNAINDMIEMVCKK